MVSFTPSDFLVSFPMAIFRTPQPFFLLLLLAPKKIINLQHRQFLPVCHSSSSHFNSAMSGRKEVLGDGTDLQVPSSSEGVSSSSTGEDQKSANSVDRVDTSQEADQSFAQSVVPSRKRPFSGVVQPERRGKAIGLSPSAALSAQVGEIHDDDARSSSSNDADTQFRNKPPSSSDYDGKGPTPNSACALQHRWDSMFDRLLAFKAKHGHCLVPNRYDEDRSLGAWVSTQRRHYKAVESGHHHHESTPLTEERVTKLREIGFVWATSDPRHTPWNVRFEELRAYRERFGKWTQHCALLTNTHMEDKYKQ